MTPMTIATLVVAQPGMFKQAGLAATALFRAVTTTCEAVDHAANGINYICKAGEEAAATYYDQAKREREQAAADAQKLLE